MEYYKSAKYANGDELEAAIEKGVEAFTNGILSKGYTADLDTCFETGLYSTDYATNPNHRKGCVYVRDYVKEHLDVTDLITNIQYDVYIVWQVKVLQNWKFLISTSLPDGMYYELTYNGDKKEWYLDAYKKFDNQRIPE